MLLLLIALLAKLLRLVTVVAVGVIAAVGLLRPVGLALLRIALLLAVLAGAVAPALIAAARHEAAHGLDHAEIMVGILPVSFGGDPIARGRRFTRQRLVLVENLMGIATHSHIRPAAIENLVSIRRTVRIVVVVLLVLIVATAATCAAATIAAATRPLPIVWSH